ncbi:MAG: hypothetical protein GX671_05910 [Clostridiales bacterium]|nr:hypothetical protein [Clostridiales bacterium]
MNDYDEMTLKVMKRDVDRSLDEIFRTRRIASLGPKPILADLDKYIVEKSNELTEYYNKMSTTTLLSLELKDLFNDLERYSKR